jgi:glycosyltransferase involved in cell wall biosynthesis
MRFTHVTLVHPSLHSVGGAERLAVDLALGFASSETQVEVVTGICHDRWREELLGNEFIALRELGRTSSGNFSFWLNVKRYAKAMAKLVSPQTDLIITSGFPSPLVAYFFKRAGSNAKVVHFIQEAPMVLHDHDGLRFLPWRLRLFYRCMGVFYGQLDITAIQSGDLLIANSQLTRRINSEIYGVKKPISVVYPGVHIDLVSQKFAIPYAIERYVKENKVILFNPKGVQLWRNPDVFLQALKDLKDLDFVAVFTLSGADCQIPLLMKRAHALGVADRVVFVPDLAAEEMAAYYSYSSVVVSIPKRQSFGMIPLEALLYGAPSIISDTSGVCEVLRDGSDVLCVPENDSKRLAKAITAIVQQPVLRDKLVSNGKQKVLMQFNSTRFVAEFKAALDFN